MSEYSMPVVSEQEREDLIGLAMIEVKRWKCADGKQYMVELMNIALAALTEKPVAIEAEVNGVMRSVSNTAERISLMSYEKG